MKSTCSMRMTVAIDMVSADDDRNHLLRARYPRSIVIVRQQFVLCSYTDLSL